LSFGFAAFMATSCCRNAGSFGSTVSKLYSSASVHAPYGAFDQYGIGVVPAGGQKNTKL